MPLGDDVEGMPLDIFFPFEKPWNTKGFVWGSLRRLTECDDVNCAKNQQYERNDEIS